MTQDPQEGLSTTFILGLLLAGEGTIVCGLFGLLVVLVIGRIGLPNLGVTLVLAAYVLVPAAMALAGYALLFRRRWGLYVGFLMQLVALVWVGYELFISKPGPYTTSADRVVIPYVAALAVAGIGLMALPGTRRNLR